METDSVHTPAKLHGGPIFAAIMGVVVMAVVCVLIVFHQADSFDEQLLTNEREITQLHDRIDVLGSEIEPNEAQIKFVRAALELMEKTNGCTLETNERILVAGYMFKYGTMYDLNPSEWEEDYIPLPYRLLSVAYVESRFRDRVTSTIIRDGKPPKVGAYGLMQLMPATFKSCSALLHMPYDNWGNEIWDLERQVQFGAYWLRMLRDDRGDWSLATTAYNCNSCGYLTDYTIKVERIQTEVFDFEPVLD